MTITVEVAKSLTLGQLLYHKSIRNADGSALRVRVNGQPQTWKTDKERFRIPTKYGIKHYGEIEPHNADEWTTEEPVKFTPYNSKSGLRLFAEMVRLADVPEPVVHFGCARFANVLKDDKNGEHLFRFWDHDGAAVGIGPVSKHHKLFCSGRHLSEWLTAEADERKDFDARR